MTRQATGEGPVFIVGAPRSGTSLLYRLLCMDPSVGYVSNYLRRAPRLTGLAVLNRIPAQVPALQRRGWFDAESNAYVYGSHRSWLARLTPQPVEGEPFFAAHGLDPDVPRGSLRAADLDGMRRDVDRLLRASGASVFVSKRIAHNRRIPVLCEAFPRARFVHVVRDGRAVAASLRSVDWWAGERLWWWGDRTPVDWEAAGGDPWQLSARTWARELEVIESGLADLPEDRVLQVRYESLVVDLRTGLKGVRDFAGVVTDDSWTERLPGDRSSLTLEGWRTVLGPTGTKTVEVEQEALLRRLGYLPDRVA